MDVFSQTIARKIETKLLGLFFMRFQFIRFFISLAFAPAFFIFNANARDSRTDSLIRAGITHISATRQGQILAADEQSNLFLFDTNGVMMYQFSPRRPARVHLLEGWNGLRPFAFYRDFQEYVILDRFLLADDNTRLNGENVGYARLAAPSQDGNLWVLDEANFQLKKIDLRTQNVLFSTPLDLVLKPGNYSLTFMREYQNQLYICDGKGPVLLFDQMGNFKKRLPISEADWIGFQGEEVYSIMGDSLVFFNPYKFLITKKSLPMEVKVKSELLIIGSKWFWVDEKGLKMNRL